MRAFVLDDAAHIATNARIHAALLTSEERTTTT